MIKLSGKNIGLAKPKEARCESHPPKTHDKSLRDMLDWLRSKDMTFKINDFYGRGYILNGVEMNDQEIVELFYKESYG